MSLERRIEALEKRGEEGLFWQVLSLIGREEPLTARELAFLEEAQKNSAHNPYSAMIALLLRVAA